ncbi:hypothetical protein [Planctomyces sp. SH-PL14]|uniref:hypothetical protein n=1 Tax=Planctomyces sp. SH-PL14 TaxID=1632864 RepID=UPI00078C36D6|nr:hypothetical protein [Planctomyces sp. SH-PL14]AMV20415.1 hypothetical protein VT03_21130 [Planctomyces sp. SH-PL14]
MNLHALLLSKQVKVTRVNNAAAAAQTAVNATGVDMAGWDGVLFIALLGTLTTTHATSLKAQQSSDNAAADDYSDIAGSSTGNMADGDSNKIILLDVFRPTKQYVRPVLVRGTANAVLDGILAIQYAGRDIPITQGSTVSVQDAVISADEGTA